MELRTNFLKDVSDFYLDIRKLLHYAIQWPNLELCPFLGFGCRFAYNMGSVGGGGYDRTSNYLYLPAGVTFKRQCKNGLSFDICGEVDWMFLGLQISWLPDKSLRDMQNNGYGVRLSGKVSKKLKNVEFFAGPFCRFWFVPRSSLVVHRERNGNYILKENFCEPNKNKNDTLEAGIKLGVSF
ncbi:hypothetical protein AGMMS49990_05440 [Endomicrobiia bacterium]|nr:hypothetical protein AGMMS49990_05440 [Endomicrobiia bacterium]